MEETNRPASIALLQWLKTAHLYLRKESEIIMLESILPILHKVDPATAMIIVLVTSLLFVLKYFVTYITKESPQHEKLQEDLRESYVRVKSESEELRVDLRATMKHLRSVNARLFELELKIEQACFLLEQALISASEEEKVNEALVSKAVDVLRGGKRVKRQ